MIIVAGGLGLLAYGIFNEYVLTPYFAEDEGVTIIPESERDFLAPTSAITTERELPP